MIDSVSLFGNGSLFPGGPLREPITSVKRANMLVLTKTDRIDASRKEEIFRQLDLLAPGKPVVMTRHKPVFFTDITGMSYPLEEIRGKRVMLVSGIADPGTFSFSMRSILFPYEILLFC